MRTVKWLLAIVAAFGVSLAAASFVWAQGVAAHVAGAQGGGAQGVVGAPRPWEIGMQRAYGPIKDREIDLNTLVSVLIVAITLLVGALLLWVIFRYNSRRNPVPSQTTHNTILEIAWTVIPVLVLVVMAIPSFPLIYYQNKAPHPDLTIKATGHQWYWEYSYPDQGNIDIESRYVHDEDLKPGQLRLLAVDNEMVIPVGKKIRILTGSSDVIHSFFIPAFGVQRYAIPGRTIETWMEADRVGTFYGECNQICGQDHSRMPIAVKVVSDADFKTWVTQAKKSAAASRLPRIASK